MHEIALSPASGELIHRSVSSGTGQTVSMPASGSRMMPLTNEDAAALGAPGRTATVGKRQAIPSTNPFLEYSCTSSSTIAFSEPYDDWGTTAMSSGTMAGREPPKTASVLVKTKRGGFSEATTRLEKRAGRVDVDSHAEIELCLGLTAHDRREVVNHVDIGLDTRAREVVVGDCPDPPSTRGSSIRAGRGIDGHERRDRRQAWRACEQRPGETTAQKSCRCR